MRAIRAPSKPCSANSGTTSASCPALLPSTAGSTPSAGCAVVRTRSSSGCRPGSSRSGRAGDSASGTGPQASAPLALTRLMRTISGLASIRSRPMPRKRFSPSAPDLISRALVVSASVRPPRRTTNCWAALSTSRCRASRCSCRSSSTIAMNRPAISSASSAIAANGSQVALRSRGASCDSASSVGPSLSRRSGPGKGESVMGRARRRAAVQRQPATSIAAPAEPDSLLAGSSAACQGQGSRLCPRGRRFAGLLVSP